jgi:methylglutaconyl-CoA hydratase
MYIQTQGESDLAEVIIDRPDRRNALDGEGWAAIGASVRAACARAGVRAVLIRSVGSVFCGGADVNWLRSAPPAELAVVSDTLAAFRSCPHPVVCRVQGPTFGGGIGLAAAADVVVADPAATFTLSEVRLGIVPALISPYVVERVGSAHLKTWAILGMTVDAASAVAAGLVDLIAPAGGVDVATAEVIEAIRRGEPEAVAAVKRFPPAGLGRDDAAQLLATLRDRPQFAEGIAAMRGGRLPTWAAPGGAKP